MSELADLRQAVAEALPGLDRVIAWQAGTTRCGPSR